MMMNKHKNRVTLSRFFATVSVVVMLGGFLALATSVFFPQQTLAVTRPEALKICNIKITDAKKQECINKVNKCQPQNTGTCLDTAVRTSGTAVYSLCRNADDPQACEARVSKDCGPPTPVREQAQCKSELARKINPNAKDIKPVDVDPTVSTTNNTLNSNAPQKYTDVCGDGDDAIKTRFNFGCTGNGNPIVDLAYAIVRFLSYGVGLVVAASIIYAGIQYSTSSGNAENTQAAKARILNAFIGLIFYLLIFAFVQFLVPGGLFN